MNKTDGEFELVLGNRQLLSAFFIVVILFGVFFTMGYIVGRNSSPASRASASANTEAGAIQAEGRPQASSGSATPAPAESASSKSELPKSTQPAQDFAVRPPVEPEKSTKEPPKPKAPADAPVTSTPARGQLYLQVAAVKAAEAEVLADTLKNKGFPTVIVSVPGSSGLFRVLVGPMADSSKLGEIKADLASAGFKNTFVQKVE